MELDKINVGHVTKIRIVLEVVYYGVRRFMIISYLY